RQAFRLPQRPQDRLDGERSVRRDLVRELARVLQRFAVWHDVTDQSDRKCFARGDEVTGQQDLGCARVRDLAPQPNGRAADGEEAATNLRQTELRTVAGDAAVGRLHHLGAARD